MVTAMNRPLHNWMRLCVPFLLLPAGCFGGKAQPARPEVQLQAETALTRGIRSEQKGDHLEAEKQLSQSLALSTSIEDNPARATALINLARLHRLQHDLPKAEARIEQALAITGIDSRLSDEAVFEKALIELANNSPAAALEWAQKAVAAERGDQLGSRLNLACRIELVRGNWNDAKELAEKALIENRSSGQAEEEANSLRILGIVARNEKNYGLGAQFLQEALQNDKRIGKSGKIAADLEELAETSRSAGNLRDASTYLERAYEVNLAGGRLRQAMGNQGALAGMFTLLGEEDKANRARETARKLESQIATQNPGSSSATINPSNRP
jgi:tetratricopeptide (TPR) repeat protein